MRIVRSTKAVVGALLGAAIVAATAGATVPSSRYYCEFAFLLGTAILFVKLVANLWWKIQAVEEELRRHNRTATGELATELYAMQVILRRFPNCSIPVTGWSMRFANLHTIIDLMDTEEPVLVVEFASGISTICIAGWLKEQGRRRLVSLEHDEDWAAITRAHLARGELNGFAEVLYAPLSPHECLGRRVDWYAVGEQIKALSGVDFLVVDGPPPVSPAASFHAYQRCPLSTRNFRPGPL